MLERVVDSHEVNLEREWKAYNNALYVETMCLKIGRDHGLSDDDCRIVASFKLFTPLWHGDVLWPFPTKGAHLDTYAEVCRLCDLNKRSDIRVQDSDWTEWINTF